VFDPRHLLAVLCMLMPAAALAQGIAYTVQVVALSDKESALQLQAQLNGEGYPAYVVRSTTGQGDVYRVRVGAFANRQAALVFADAMPPTAGGRPVPALAEAIPPGIVSLAPRVLTRIVPEGREVTVLPWLGGVAVRLQSRSPLTQARYVTLLDGAVDTFDAWLAVPGEDGSVTRVQDLPLWPEGWADDSADAREAYRASVLSLVADGVSLPLSDVRAAEYRPDPEGPPVLVVLERVVPGSGDASTLLALGVPELGMTPTGPGTYLGLEPGELPAAGEGTVLLRDAAGDAPLTGDGWSARADGVFLRLLQPGGASWRAGVGTPLWTDGRVLVTADADSFLFYDFLPR